MTLSLVKLRLQAPLHVGSSTLGEEDTYDYAPSDTLFSALCHAYLGAFGKDALERLLERFDRGEPPFLISSAFPYHEDALFLPLPRVAPPERAERVEREERGDRKRLKKTSWVSLENFGRLLRGEDIQPQRDDRLPRKELLPRVALDRESSGSSIYYVRRAVFPESGGLWTLLDVMDERFTRKLRQTFHLLGDMGIGGERTMGCGFFEPEFGEAPPELADHLKGTAPYISLSRVGGVESAGAVDLYALVESRGWMASPTGAQRKRKSVLFFAEGSSFNERARGELLHVTPDEYREHKVFRYGYGMYLGRTR